MVKCLATMAHIAQYDGVFKDCKNRKVAEEDIDEENKKELEKLLGEYSCVFYFHPR